MKRPPLYGLLAEFENPEDLLAAAHKTRERGYKRIDAYTPLPVEGLSEAVGYHHTTLPLVVLIGGIIGGLTGFLMQYWVSVIEYPVIVGGRPFNSWPSFIPVTFECTVLAAALTAVFGMLAMNGLPTPYHPVFNEPRFVHASRNRFFLCIKSRDPKFHFQETRRFLETLKPYGIYDITS